MAEGQVLVAAEELRRFATDVLAAGGRIEQDAVCAELHRDGHIRSGSDAGVYDNRISEVAFLKVLQTKSDVGWV